MAAKFKLRGGDKLMRLLRNAPQEAQDEVRRVIRANAEALRAQMQGAAPTPPGKSGESTGALKAAIRIRYSQKGLRARVGVFGPTKRQRTRIAGVAAGLKAKRGLTLKKAKRIAQRLAGDVFYASFVEFGTQKMAAQPFIYPEFRAKRTKIRNEIVKAATTAIRKAAR